MKNKRLDWLILIIPKAEKELVEKNIIKEKILPIDFAWTSEDLGKEFSLLKFSGNEELITKLSFCLSDYRDSLRKYQGNFIRIDKTGIFK